MAKKNPKPPKRRRPSRAWKFYRFEGGRLVRVNRFCPRCGRGVYMAEHSDRWSCGKCGYTEFK